MSYRSDIILACGAVVLLCGTVLLGLPLADVRAESSPNDCTEACHCGWKASYDYLGGVECQHGEDADPDCAGRRAAVIQSVRDACIEEGVAGTTLAQAAAWVPEMFECCETTPKTLKITLPDDRILVLDFSNALGDCATNPCHCYDCVNNGNPVCEGVILTWVAACGLLDQKPSSTSTCGEFENTGGANEFLRYERAVTDPAGGAGCSSTANGVGRKYYCGGATLSEIEYTKCLGSNCNPSSGNQTWVGVDASRGQRIKCKGTICVSTDGPN